MILHTRAKLLDGVLLRPDGKMQSKLDRHPAGLLIEVPSCCDLWIVDRPLDAGHLAHEKIQSR